MEQAQYYFQRAVEKDPGFALAYLGLADMAYMGGDNPEARGAVAKAIELDSSLGEAHATSGFASMFHKWDWQKAEDYFKQSILLNPGYGIAHQWYATLLAITGLIEGSQTGDAQRSGN